MPTTMPTGSPLPLVAVTGSRRPYIYDLPFLLSLPEGFEHRFRYHRVWISDDVEKQSAASLVGQPLLLLFHSLDRRRLLPLRYCSVVAVDHLGPLVFVRFTVGPFVEVKREALLAKIDSEERESESARLDRIGRDLIGAHSYDLSKDLPKGEYFRRAVKEVEDLKWAKPSANDTQETSFAWATLASLLMNEKALARVPMFHLLGFQAMDGHFQAPETLGGLFTPSPGKVKGFKIVEGEHYRLRILEWCETIKEPMRPARIAAAAAPEVLSLEGSSNLVVGPYDVLEFSFRARRPGYTELLVSLESVAPQPKEGTDQTPATTNAETARDPAQHQSRRPDDVLQGSSDDVTRNMSGPTWPSIYAARVPVLVRHNWARVVILGAIGVGGGIIYLTLSGKLWELLGLLLMFTTLGEYLERFVKFSADVRDLSLGRGQAQSK